MKGSGLYVAKRECDKITSSSVATTTNLLPSFSMTHAEGGMARFGSKSVSSFDHQTLVLVKMDLRPSWWTWNSKKRDGGKKEGITVSYSSMPTHN